MAYYDPLKYSDPRIYSGYYPTSPTSPTYSRSNNTSIPVSGKAMQELAHRINFTPGEDGSGLYIQDSSGYTWSILPMVEKLLDRLLAVEEYISEVADRFDDPAGR